MQYVVFRICLLWLSTIIWDSFVVLLLLLVSRILWYGYTSVYPFTYQMISGLILVWGESAYKHSHAGFCMRISFPFFWVNIQEWDFWVYYEKLLNCFPAWLHFAFSPVNYESHGFFLPSSLNVVCFLGGLVFCGDVFVLGRGCPIDM